MTFRDRLYLSTVADDAASLAEQYRLGLEIADFCTASNMDATFEPYGRLGMEKMKYANRFVFHAPFSELSPCAVDPRVRKVVMERFQQALALSQQLGIRRIVAHTGFIPLVYYESWLVDQSVTFWKELLSQQPDNVEILLENVMEPGPELQLAIAQAVADPRFRICLDVGHANAAMSKTPVMEWIEPLSPYLSHIHLHNNLGDYDLHSNLADGNIPISQILDALESRCPEVTYTIETMHVQPSVEYLFENGYLK